MQTDNVQKKRDAIIAGLVLLKCGINKHEGYWPVDPNDGDVGDILTCSGDHDGLSLEEIDAICEHIDSVNFTGPLSE